MIIHRCEENKDISPSTALANLFTWATTIGIVVSPKIKYPCEFSPGYLGTKVAQDINPEEVIITVPNSAMLSTKLSNPPELHGMFSEHPDMFSLPNREHEDYRMLSFLLWEMSKGPASFWNCYFQSLPEAPETITEWKEKELLELQDSDFANDAMIRKNWNMNCCKELSKIYKMYPLLFKDELSSPQKVHWCWLIMTTRCFGGGLPYSSLIPIADFINHSNGPTLYFYGSESDLVPDSIDLCEEDADDNLIDESDCIHLSYRKLQKINFASYEPTEDIKAKGQTLYDEGKTLDYSEAAAST